jgi:CYTH domain-containing protein
MSKKQAVREDDARSFKNMSDKQVFKIVLTGGPCAGKSTVLSLIKERVSALGFDVLIVPEAATLLIGGGFTYNRNDWQEAANFQVHLLQVQLALEEAFLSKAWNSMNKTLIVCDRGAMDGKAFCSDDAWRIVLESIELTTQELRDKRYDAVLHLETAAIGAPEFYTCANNPARLEKNLKDAVEADNKLKDAWVGCPHLRVIPASKDFTEKVKNVMIAISRVIGVPLPIEFERKFLVKKVGDIPVHSEEVEIIQYYLQSNSSGIERIRERRQNGSSVFFHTVKRPNNIGCIEEERIISPFEYSQFSNRIDKERSPINKRRKCFLWEGQYFELDTFIFPRPRLQILEIELDSKEQPFSLPPFIEVEKEVTDDPTYTNFVLSEIK